MGIETIEEKERAAQGDPLAAPRLIRPTCRRDERRPPDYAHQAAHQSADRLHTFFQERKVGLRGAAWIVDHVANDQ